MYLGDIFRIFSRRKPMDSPNKGESLARYLSTLDLTALGIGSTLGVGVYVLAGSVSKEIAGPAVILSFAIAAVASMIAGKVFKIFLKINRYDEVSNDLTSFNSSDMKNMKNNFQLGFG